VQLSGCRAIPWRQIARHSRDTGHLQPPPLGPDFYGRSELVQAWADYLARAR